MADGGSTPIEAPPDGASGAPPSRRRWRTWLMWLTLCGLNLLLFAPSYAFRDHHSHGEYRMDVRSGWEYAKALVFCCPGRDVFRVSYEFGLLVAALALASKARGRAVARGAGVAAYGALLLFVTYDRAILYFFNRTPALWEDWRLIINLGHYLGDFLPVKWTGLAAGAGVLLILALFAVERLFAGFQQWARSCPTRHLCAGTLAFALSGGLSLGWFGPRRDDTTVQLLSARMADNYRASRERMAAVSYLAHAKPDRRNDVLMDVELARRPNVYLLMIEAYGELLATCDTRTAYQALLGRIWARLSEKGFSARSAYSHSPVHSGWSWLSIGTLQTGIRINQLSTYSMLELVGARIPSLTSFFRKQGYHTISLQPANRDRNGIRRLDVFNRHELIEAPQLHYGGPRAHWGSIPDEYSLGYFRENYLSHAAEPRFVFYISVSTHYPFRPIPYVGDWRAWNGSGFPPARPDPAWPPLEGVQLIAVESRRNYLAAIEYEWRLLSDFIQAEAQRRPDSIFFVVGDHQPRLDCGSSKITYYTPVHVLSKDAGFVERFSDVGLSPGLFTEPGTRPPLNHEGLFSLIVTKLGEHHGRAGHSAGEYFPEGIGLGGLMR